MFWVLESSAGGLALLFLLSLLSNLPQHATAGMVTTTDTDPDAVGYRASHAAHVYIRLLRTGIGHTEPILLVCVRMCTGVCLCVCFLAA